MRLKSLSEITAAILCLVLAVILFTRPAAIQSEAVEAPQMAVSQTVTGTRSPTPTHTFTPSPTPTNTRVPPPTNDLYANAIVINALPFQTMQVFGGATKSDTDPQLLCGTDPYVTTNFHSTVWFTYTTPVDQSVLIDMGGSDLTFVFAVLTGSEGQFTQVNCSKSSMVGGRHGFFAHAGVTYSILLSPKTGVAWQDPTAHPIRFTSVPIVPNDDIAHATPIAGLPLSFRQEMYGATMTANDPRFRCIYGLDQRYHNTVWYQMTPAAQTQLNIEVSDPANDLILAVFSGTPANLTLQTCSTSVLRITAALNANTPYYVMIGFSGVSDSDPQPPGASFVVDVRFSRTVQGDTPQDAIPLSGFPVSATVDIAGTTSGIPDAQCTGFGPSSAYQSLWFSYTPSTTVGIVIQAWESDFPYQIAVFTGTPDNLTTLHCRDDSIGFTAQAGTTYRIMLTTTQALTVYPPGTLARLRIVAPYVSNDLAETPLVIPPGASAYSNQQDVALATRNSTDLTSGVSSACRSSDTYAADRRYSVWYAWTPNAARDVILSTAGSSYTTYIEVFPGSDASCGLGTRSLQAQAGVTYLIKISYSSLQQLISPALLNFSLYETAVANDFEQNAQSVPAIPFAFEQDVSGATAYTNEREVFGCGAYSHSVWFTYTADANRTLVFDTTNSDFDTIIGIPTSGYEEYMCNETAPQNGSSRARFELNARAGTTYTLMIAHNSAAPLTAPALLRLTVSETVSNGVYAHARVISPDALLYADEPDLNGTPDSGGSLPCSVGSDHHNAAWYTFTPNLNGVVQIEFDLRHDARLAVWRVDTGQPVECSFNTGWWKYSERIVFPVSAGTTYAIYGGVSGYLHVNTLYRGRLDFQFTPRLDLIAPVGHVSGQPTFTWKHIPGATWYYLWLDSQETGHVLDQWVEAVNVCTSAVCSFNLPVTLAEQGNYQWWVQPFYPSTGYGIWSIPAAFGYAIAPPIPTAPLGSIADPAQPTFTWTRVPGAMWYSIWLSGAMRGYISDTWIDAYGEAGLCGAETCSTTLPLSLLPDVYTWWVQAWSPIAGYSAWSVAAQFTVPYPPPVPYQPSGVITQTQPTFVWSNAPYIAWHYLWVSGSSGHVWNAWYGTTAHCPSDSLCQVTPPIALPPGTYQFWVQQWSPGTGYSAWSAAQSFVVAAPSGDSEAAPTLTPADFIDSAPPLEVSSTQESVGRGDN